MTARDSAGDQVFVGIPCYNRHEGLRNTIRCLQQQTHRNWTALICDNASPNPALGEVAQAAAAADPRIQYLRHDQNIGAAANFRFAALQADAPFFMWASDDDLWHPDFMAANLQQLRQQPHAQLSFCSIDVMNVSGELLFRCPGFSRFTSSGNLVRDATKYLEDPEVLGKANLIYGIYRTPVVQACVTEFWDTAFSTFYGGDFVFLFSLISRHPIVAHDEFHMRKRQPTRARTKIHWRHPRSYRVTRAEEFEAYLSRMQQVAPSPELATAADQILRRRQWQRFLYLLPFASRLLESGDRKSPVWPRLPVTLRRSAAAWS